MLIKAEEETDEVHVMLTGVPLVMIDAAVGNVTLKITPALGKGKRKGQ
jgi:hypothetical protein